jgi:hypothetical protein
MSEEAFYVHDEEKQEKTLKFQDFLYLCISKWYWFVISLVFFLGCACFYILSTQPIYTRQASILIKDEDGNSSISKQFGQFSDIGFGKSNTNLYNEMITLKSPTYMEEVVKALHLDMQYSVKGTFHDTILYAKTLPINVILPDMNQDCSATLTVALPATGLVELSEFTLQGMEKPSKVIKAHMGETVRTPIGNVMVTPSPYYTGKYVHSIQVAHVPVEAVTASIVGQLSVELTDDNSSVVDLRLNDASPQRAEDILNKLFEVYNGKWVEDINQQAISTSEFIDEELRAIEADLGHVDEDISSYKSKNLVPDIQANAAISLNRAEVTNQQLLELENQLYMAKYIKSQLNDSKGFKILPVNSGFDNSNVGSQIVVYNERVMQRNNLVANSSASNPLVVDLDQGLIATKASIIASLNSIIATMNNKLASLHGNASEAKEQIATNPTQAKYLLSVERQQKVKEELYTFLLQKREENQLSKAFTAYNTKMLNPPAGKKTPTKPVKGNILVVAFIMGLLVPVLILLLLNSLDTMVHSRQDLKMLTIPFIGELPLSYKKHSGLLSFMNKKKDVRKIVVQEQCRNEINEAFRVIRTNLEFVSGKEGTNKVIMFTSTNPESGKTFTTVNLATSFAIKGKRVLVIDLDMRKASLSTFVNNPSLGISDYLTGRIEDFDTVMVKGKIHANLDILPVGTIPPNPTELLFSERLSDMLNKTKDLYDYIFIDCPPVEIVADASIINKFCDMTIYVIRAGFLDRAQLPDIEKYYVEKRYRNLNLIFNGVSSNSGGYGHKYGYSYGYGDKS